MKLRFCRVILVVGIVSYHWTSSSGAIDPNTSSHPKGYITLRSRKRGLSWCQTCLIPIGIGRAIIFFVQAMDWVCRLEEWVTIPHGFDNTWGIVKDSGLISSTSSLFFTYLFQFFNVVYFFHFQLAFVHVLQTSKKLSSVGSQRSLWMNGSAGT